MKRIVLVVVAISLLNFSFGFLYQLSNGIVCLVELGILAIGGIIFWLGSYKILKSIVSSYFADKVIWGDIRFLTLGASLGLVSSLLNLVFCYLFLVSMFTLLFNCNSPSFNLLNASLTNSQIGSLLCFVVLFVLISKDISEKTRKKDFGDLKGNQTLNPLRRDYVMLSHRNKKIKIGIGDISYVEVTNNCITVHAAGKKYVKYQSLTSFQNQLPSNGFIKVSRSALVNLSYVKEVQLNKYGDGLVILKNGDSVKLSRSNKRALISAMEA